MSRVTIPVPCGIAVAAANEIEARGNAFQLVVPAEHETGPLFIEFQLWEGGCELPHTIRLHSNGTWSMTTEIEV